MRRLTEPAGEVTFGLLVGSITEHFRGFIESAHPCTGTGNKRTPRDDQSVLPSYKLSQSESLRNLDTVKNNHKKRPQGFQGDPEKALKSLFVTIHPE